MDTTTTTTTPPTLEEQFAALKTAELPAAIRALEKRLAAELAAQPRHHVDRAHLGSYHALARAAERVGRAEGGVRMAAEQLEAAELDRARAAELAKNEK